MTGGYRHKTVFLGEKFLLIKIFVLILLPCMDRQKIENENWQPEKGKRKIKKERYINYRQKKTNRDATHLLIKKIKIYLLTKGRK